MGGTKAMSTEAAKLRARFAQHLASTIDADLAAAHAKGTTPATAALQVAVAAFDKAIQLAEQSHLSPQGRRG